jgi:hypothetical protein
MEVLNLRNDWGWGELTKASVNECLYCGQLALRAGGI